MTGQCDRGCAAGWRWSLCNIGILKLLFFDISLRLHSSLQDFLGEIKKNIFGVRGFEKKEAITCYFY